jgi:acetyl-CoA synthetase
MSEFPTRPVPANFKDAHINAEQYQAMYKRSIEDPEGFWSEMANEFLSWDQPWNEVVSYDFIKGEAAWFSGGKLNVSYNCIDRHLPERADQTALIWEGDDPADSKHITYGELKEHVCKLANALKSRGVKKGDRVCIYMPMIPEAAYAMLACTRIGAIHSIVFGGFSPEALKDRILDSDCQTLITADEGVRGGKAVPLKVNADKALASCPNVHTCLVVERTANDVDWQDGRDVWYHDLVDSADNECEPESMDAEDPLFILYTSGSTGKPKGVLHTTGGYLLQASMTFKYVFDYREGEIYWCTADVGWVTGHTYIVYGPLANGAISLMFEGVPTYPDAGRCWEVVDKHQVNTFYTAPTAIRALQAVGDEPVTRSSRTSLRLLGTVGEPINPEAWTWYYEVVGDSRCPVIDTWWQTETGAHMITPLPGATDLKPGSATFPFFGVELALLNEDGSEIEGGEILLAQPDPQRLWRSPAHGGYLLQQLPGLLLHRRRRQPRRGRLLLDHRTGGRRAQRLRPPHGDRRGGKRPGAARRHRRGRRSGLPPRHQGPGHLRLRHPDAGGGADRGTPAGIDSAVRAGNRPHRQTGRHPVGPRPAQDPLG